MKKYLILLFLLVFLLPAGQAKARPAEFVGIGLMSWYAEHPIRAAGKLLQATADTMGVAKKKLRYSVETVAKSAAYGVRRLVGLGPSVGSDPISSSGSGPGSSGSGGTNIDRHSYWSGRHDQFSRKEPPFSVNGSSSSDPGSSGGAALAVAVLALQPAVAPLLRVPIPSLAVVAVEGGLVGRSKRGNLHLPKFAHSCTNF